MSDQRAGEKNGAGSFWIFYGKQNSKGIGRRWVMQFLGILFVFFC